MTAPVEWSALSGLDQIRAIFAGKTGYEGMVKTLNLQPVSAEEGLVVFEGSPTRAVYNPLGVVHGGYAATLLDTVMGCAVHSCIKAGERYTTLELKIAYHRALAEASGPVRAEGPRRLGRKAGRLRRGQAARQGRPTLRERHHDLPRIQYQRRGLT